MNAVNSASRSQVPVDASTGTSSGRPPTITVLMTSTRPTTPRG